MSELKEQIKTTWEVHHKIMMMMLENLPEEAMSATLSTRGGRDVSRQFAHLHMVRVWRMESFAKKVGGETHRI